MLRLLPFALLFGTSFLACAGDHAKVEQASVGRWQIVHGPPSGLYRTFLIDTVTGDTFIVCGDPKGAEIWCRMYRTEQAARPEPRGQ